MEKYMELDNLIILFQEGERRYAYIPDIGIHHPFLSSLSNLAYKRRRNLETMYFNQPNTRYWTWIDWDNPAHIMKLLVWIVYCYSVFPSFLVGIYKCIRHNTWVGLYEVPFNLLTTTVIIMAFVKQTCKQLR